MLHALSIKPVGKVLLPVYGCMSSMAEVGLSLGGALLLFFLLQSLLPSFFFPKFVGGA